MNSIYTAHQQLYSSYELIKGFNFIACPSEKELLNSLTQTY